MIKTKKVKNTIPREVITNAYCDFCGNEFNKVITKCQGFGSVIISFGYGSSFDGENFGFDICDKCFLEKFGDSLGKELKKGGFSDLIIAKIKEKKK